MLKKISPPPEEKKETPEKKKSFNVTPIKNPIKQSPKKLNQDLNSITPVKQKAYK